MRLSVSVAMYSECRSGSSLAGRRAPLAQQELDVRRMRKLRRAAEAAELRDRSCCSSCSRAACERRARQRRVVGGGRRRQLVERLLQRCALLARCPRRCVAIELARPGCSSSVNAGMP